MTRQPASGKERYSQWLLAAAREISMYETFSAIHEFSHISQLLYMEQGILIANTKYRQDYSKDGTKVFGEENSSKSHVGSPATF